MKLRKGSVADVLWFMAVIMIFIIIMRSQLEFTSTATIDSYAKNIVNTEASRFVADIAGYAKNDSNCNMYNSKGEKRLYSWKSTATSLDDNEASPQAIFNYAKDKMISNIKAEFASHSTLSERVGSRVSNTVGLANGDIIVDVSDTGKSTLVTVTVQYKVLSNSYKPVAGGFVENSADAIPRKVVITRNVENPLRFK